MPTKLDRYRDKRRFGETPEPKGGGAAEAEPIYQVMKDIVAVEWLSLAAAIERLSNPLEKVFLINIGRHAILRARRPQRRKAKMPAEVRRRGGDPIERMHS